MDLKEQIIRRRSIRKYDMTPLSDEVLRTVSEFAGTCERPFSGNIGSKIVTREEFFAMTGGVFRINGPHYLVFFGDKDDDNVLKNIGYVGELTVLRMTEMGLGTCWLGGAVGKKTPEGAEYVISICFGTPAEKFCDNENEAKRRDLRSIASNFSPEQEDVLRYVRLAPSARNGQPWHFECADGVIHVFRTSSLMSGLAVIKMLQKIDIGIAVSHFRVCSFSIDKRPQIAKGMTYECTIVPDTAAR